MELSIFQMKKKYIERLPVLQHILHYPNHIVSGARNGTAIIMKSRKRQEKPRKKTELSVHPDCA